MCYFLVFLTAATYSPLFDRHSTEIKCRLADFISSVISLTFNTKFSVF